MNWVEHEYFAVAEIYNPDIWLFGEPVAPRCQHRFSVRPNPVPPIARGFYRLDLISKCSRCGAEA